MEKTKEQLETELRMKEITSEERKESDKRYAVKLVERVVWALLASAFLYLAFWYFSHITSKTNDPTTAIPTQLIPK